MLSHISTATKTRPMVFVHARMEFRTANEQIVQLVEGYSVLPLSLGLGQHQPLSASSQCWQSLFWQQASVVYNHPKGKKEHSLSCFEAPTVLVTKYVVFKHQLFWW